MRQDRKPRRGQPLYALGGLVGLWAAGRVIATALPVAAPAIPEQVNFPAGSALVAGRQTGQENVAALPQGQARQEQPVDQAFAPLPPRASPSLAPLPRPLPGLVPLAPAIAPSPLAGPADTPPAPAATLAPARPNPTLAGGHQLLFLAAFSQVPIPSELLPVASAPRAPLARRWSGDGWLLLRRGGGAPALAAIGGTYGASQAGMVLRYRIDTTSPYRPSAYMRTSAALNGVREQEAALGLSLRPLSGLPVLAMAEARATRTVAGTRVRPAMALVTEIPPLALPLRLSAEAYGQAGWVGGNGATAFVDGQLRLERPLAKIGGADLSAGGGLWGGAQNGASRLDAGPTARITLHPTEQSTLRLAADWRFRIGGKAAPRSGPAITLSAGF